MAKIEGLVKIDNVLTNSGLLAPTGEVIEVHAPDSDNGYWRLHDDEGRVYILSEEGGVVIEATGIAPPSPEAAEETEI